MRAGRYTQEKIGKRKRKVDCKSKSILVFFLLNSRGKRMFCVHFKATSALTFYLSTSETEQANVIRVRCSDLSAGLKVNEEN